MTITQYLGTGSTSRGRMVVTPQLNTRVSIPPYLRDANDKAAVIEGLERVRKYFQPISNLTWVRPASNQTSTQFVDSVSFIRPLSYLPIYPFMSYCYVPLETENTRQFLKRRRRDRSLFTRDRFPRRQHSAALTTGSAQPRWDSTMAESTTAPLSSTQTPKYMEWITSSSLTRPYFPA